ncbi:TIGR03757 family integrating conjugative element protein [Methylocaldum sp. 14B]|jgi:integrating conjugative element protein (TIGR03757 family)|uniref:TIGR03757 family integrating conjugative element protein n=1 Tax=Methylocaldum sp. 14B TaxID=1912213 RepID=UPI00098A19D6|nr:TIGR03757 family integrating conjugative element protein [Methylocaldum sp. 14B]
MNVLLALSLFLLATSLRADGPETMEVFTDSRFPVTGLEDIRQRSGARVTIHDLGAPAGLEETLSGGLPNTEAEALQVVRQRFSASFGELRQRFLQAYQGHTQAMTYGIDRYPAVVFDGRAVLYGVTDLVDALARYHRWKEVQTP